MCWYRWTGGYRARSRNPKGTFAGTFVPPAAGQTRLSWHRGEDDVDSVHQERQHFARVDLYWLPLGAGDASGCVHWNGRLFEAMVARHQHRQPRDLYHSALMVHLGGDRYAIEMAPAWGSKERDRGVVSEGAVGVPWLGRSRYFRYEIRRWRDGTIPDIAEAVASPQPLSTDLSRASKLLDLVPAFPAVTWGRDVELQLADRMAARQQRPTRRRRRSACPRPRTWLVSRADRCIEAGPQPARQSRLISTPGERLQKLNGQGRMSARSHAARRVRDKRRASGIP